MGWRCGPLPGDNVTLSFSNLGDNGDDPKMHWGIWAVVLPGDAPRPSIQSLDALAEKWCTDIPRAIGIQQELQVEQEGWDEIRLRALCEKHGWEFEWMTEDGERRRRANERKGFFSVSEHLVGARQAAEAAAARVQSAIDDNAANSTVAVGPSPTNEQCDAVTPSSVDASQRGAAEGVSAADQLA